MKNLLITITILFFSTWLTAQSKYAETDREMIKQYLNRRDTIPFPHTNSNETAIKNILRSYADAIQRLDVKGSEELFMVDSRIYESGIDEGNYTNYLASHLLPELRTFKSIAFTNYQINVESDGKYAFASESYNCTITLLKNDTEIKFKNLSTSVLKKVKGKWKIMIMHSSTEKN